MTTDPAQIRRDIDNTRGELSSDVNALTNKVNPRRAVGQRANRARDALSTVKDKVMGTATQAGQAGKAKPQAGKAKAAAQGSPGEMTRKRTEGSPLAAGAIAFGVGVLVSSLLPPTQREQQVAGQAKGKAAQRSGQVKQKAKEAATDVGHDMKQPAKQAAASVASTAAHGASALREQGRSAAHDVQGQAREAKESARRQ
ncbi:MAG TPA: DUF3618 domain-containing protein [Micromonosporaceae bacterium]|nr:DUF3618 domain-containing protein [Micromonosporaceae bacterium]